MNLKRIEDKAKKDIAAAADLNELTKISDNYLGKKGEVTLLLRSLKEMSGPERKEMGQKTNRLKNFIQKQLAQKTLILKEKITREKEEKEWLDITLPGKKPFFGHLHPLTIARKKIEEIFQSMGFSIVEGPEMEKEWYNFDALNIPKDHPARDLWDTLYLKNGLLLRTHTSPVQIRYLEKHKPPLRIIVPGAAYRREATDASHEFQFFHIEGLMVDKNISVANLKAVLHEFFGRFFDMDIRFELRPDYFPFVEPGFEVAISCLVCRGKGCPACKKSGWMEVAGAGMVHPNVFKNVKLLPGSWPDGWQGWAFGFGLERLAMLKYKINHIRLFRENDLRFLEQF